jgi:polar amino acid transport system substrate-binding protein
MKTDRHNTTCRWLACALAGLFALAVHAAPPVLLVGTAADYQPLVYRKDGAVVGMEADFARLLGAQLGKTLQFKVLPPADLLPALEKGEVDLVMSGWRITPEREQRVLFADSYVKVGLIAIIRTDDVGRFHNPAALLRGGYKAAAVAAGEANGYIGRNLANVTVVPVADAAAGLQALQDKRVDVFIDDASSSWNIATDPKYGALMSLGRLLTEEPVAWAVNKNHPELRDQLNRALRTLQQTGVLEHIYDRWIPMNSATSD